MTDSRPKRDRKPPSKSAFSENLETQRQKNEDKKKGGGKRKRKSDDGSGAEDKKKIKSKGKGKAKAKKRSKKVFCLCKQPYDKSRPMIGCDSCEEWYHLDCVGLAEEELESIETYECVSCGKGSKNGSGDEDDGYQEYEDEPDDGYADGDHSQELGVVCSYCGNTVAARSSIKCEHGGYGGDECDVLACVGCITRPNTIVVCSCGMRICHKDVGNHAQVCANNARSHNNWVPQQGYHQDQ